MLAGVPSNQKLREAFLSVYRVVQMILLYVCAASRLLHERWCCTMNSGVVKASNMRGFVHEERVCFLRTLQIKAYCRTSLGCQRFLEITLSSFAGLLAQDNALQGVEVRRE